MLRDVLPYVIRVFRDRAHMAAELGRPLNAAEHAAWDARDAQVSDETRARLREQRERAIASRGDR